MRRSSFTVSLGLLSVSLVGAVARPASADTAASLNAMEVEARQLATDVPQVSISQAVGHQKLTDSIVAFRMGDYSGSSLTLFDLIGAKALVGPEAEQGNYYLAESLYLKGDRGAARTYYTAIAALPSSKYYRPSLIRLVEIAIIQKDDASDLITQLDRTGNGPDIAYIKGKYAFANAKYDDAISYFGQVPAGDPLALQAGYYSATASVAKNDLPRATQAFTDVSNKHPKSANDRRVIELSQIALGRLYYQQDQFTQSITSYLLIDRKSDLFSEALYEVGWVYVKNKQFDKALRALELLAEADPDSQKTPTVKLLEGNLRIRKAQMLRKTEIEQTAGSNQAIATANDITAEYDKATALFTSIHNAYGPAYQALKQVVDAKADPTPYVLQIAGRSNNYAATVPLPEVAQQWLKDEPAVDRFIQIESDLGQIDADLGTSEALIARLDAVISAKDKTQLYPAIAQRRTRVEQMEDSLIKIREDLADQELRLVDSNGELSGLTAQRKTIGTQYANLGDPERAFTDRVTKNHADFDAVDKSTAEIDQALTQSQAMAMALRKYSADMASNGKPLPDDITTAMSTGLDAAAQEAQAIDTELTSIKQELQLGRDLASTGDDEIMGARDMRKQLRGAIDAEHRVLAGFASASRDPGKSKSLAALADQAARISQSLDQTEAQLDASVQKGIDQTKTQLEAEKVNVAQLRSEQASVEQEAKDASSTVVAEGFSKVKDKLYDVVIRADVGTVDVAWAQKSDTDDDLKRFNLNRTRELKQLKDEFKDILEGGVPKPSAPKKDEGMPKATEPVQSPDKGGGGRVKPVEQNPKKGTDPTVKPDEQKKTDPKKTDPKKADPKKTGTH